MYQSRIRNGKKKSTRNPKRVLEDPSDGQEFAVVQDLLGNGRLRALCEDGQVRLGRIRGSMRKFKGKVIIENGDLVLVSRRDFEDDKVDVITKYTHEEAMIMIKQYEIPEHLIKTFMHTDASRFETGNANDDYIVFAGEDGADGAGCADGGAESDGSIDPETI